MTTQAWIFLAVAWSVILAATGYCFTRLLTSERQFDAPEEEPPGEGLPPEM